MKMHPSAAKGIVFILPCAALLLVSGCDAKVSWYAPGPVQVLASSNELRLFVQIDRIVAKSDGPADAPRQYPVGHVQELIEFTASGKTQHQELTLNARHEVGHSFHPNN